MILITLAIIVVLATAAIMGVRYRRSRRVGDLAAAGVCVVAVVLALALS